MWPWPVEIALVNDELDLLGEGEISNCRETHCTGRASIRRIGAAGNKEPYYPGTINLRVLAGVPSVATLGVSWARLSQHAAHDERWVYSDHQVDSDPRCNEAVVPTLDTLIRR